MGINLPLGGLCGGLLAFLSLTATSHSPVDAQILLLVKLYKANVDTDLRILLFWGQKKRQKTKKNIIKEIALLSTEANPLQKTTENSTDHTHASQPSLEC